MAFYINLLILTSLVPASLSAVRISEVRGPDFVRNGSVARLVLDCVFSAREPDLAGLVVKWYFNRKPFPVYQWIPGNKPQALGFLRGRVDLEYEAASSVPSSSPSLSSPSPSSHRALALLNPRPDLTGEFSCGVSSFAGEDFKTKNLVVYVPASVATLTYRKPSSGILLLTCRAEGLFPEPEITVYKSGPNSGSFSPRLSILLEDVSKRVRRRETTATTATTFDVSADVSVRTSDLSSDDATRFTCRIAIPGTDYEVTKAVFYTPGKPQHQRSVLYGNGSTWLHPTLTLLSLAIGASLLLHL